MPADDELPIVDELGEALYRAALAADARVAAPRRRAHRGLQVVPAMLLALTVGLLAVAGGGLLGGGANRTQALSGQLLREPGVADDGLASVPMPLRSLLTLSRVGSAPVSADDVDQLPNASATADADAVHPPVLRLPNGEPLDSIINPRGSLQ
jgi:hypothetical protein